MIPRRAGSGPEIPRPLSDRCLHAVCSPNLHIILVSLPFWLTSEQHSHPLSLTALLAKASTTWAEGTTAPSSSVSTPKYTTPSHRPTTSSAGISPSVSAPSQLARLRAWWPRCVTSAAPLWTDPVPRATTECHSRGRGATRRRQTTTICHSLRYLCDPLRYLSLWAGAEGAGRGGAGQGGRALWKGRGMGLETGPRARSYLASDSATASWLACALSCWGLTTPAQSRYPHYRHTQSKLTN